MPAGTAGAAEVGLAVPETYAPVRWCIPQNSGTRHDINATRRLMDDDYHGSSVVDPLESSEKRYRMTEHGHRNRRRTAWMSARNGKHGALDLASRKTRPRRNTIMRTLRWQRETSWQVVSFALLGFELAPRRGRKLHKQGGSSSGKSAKKKQPNVNVYWVRPPGI